MTTQEAEDAVFLRMASRFSAKYFCLRCTLVAGVATVMEDIRGKRTFGPVG